MEGDIEKLLDKHKSPSGLEELKPNPEIMLNLAKHSKTRDSHVERTTITRCSIFIFQINHVNLTKGDEKN